MSRALLTIGLFLLTASVCPGGEKRKPGYAKKGGLSLTVTLAKKAYGPADEVTLRFALKNETDKVLFIGDGFLAPNYHEAGPGRHFEVHVKVSGDEPLYFWSGMGTEGESAGIRKVFKLKPGEVYKGAIRLSAGAEKDRKFAELPHEQRGGSFENKVTRKGHVLGKDGRMYTLELRYQVDPQTHGVWQPPADFKDALLWKGELTSGPLDFEVSGR
jgi:hypothetical protein